MSLAKGVIVQASANPFGVETSFRAADGTVVTAGTASARVSQVQADRSLRAVDFNTNPPTVLALESSVPTTATLALANHVCGGVARDYWSATAVLPANAVYLVEFTPPAGAVSASSKLIQYGSVDGDLVVTSAGLVGIDGTRQPAVRNQDSVTAPTYDDCLVGAWVEAFGKESEAGTSYTKQKPDNSAAIRTFTVTLDAGNNPTARA